MIPSKYTEQKFTHESSQTINLYVKKEQYNPKSSLEFNMPRGSDKSTWYWKLIII